MRKRYDFSKGVRNPYARKLKQPVTIRLESQTVDYFKALAERKGIPYQSLINLYLRDCAERRVELEMAWKVGRQGAA
jgi:predicted DNA binding CopG/RHH family protein